MLSVSEIRNVKFSKSMSGYKQDEVDVLLDKVEADYAQFERIIKDFQQKNEELNSQIEEYKNAQNSIQNVLLSAQQLADKIVNDAKEKSEEIIKGAESSISLITAREKELSTTFELKAQERKAELEKELAEMTERENKKAEAIKKAACDSVERQQLLYDKLKLEISTFKSAITSKYKEHLEILSAIPDTVPSDPTRIAEIVAAQLDKEPDISQFLNKESDKADFDDKNDAVNEPVFEEVTANSNGFSVDGIADVADEDEETEVIF